MRTNFAILKIPSVRFEVYKETHFLFLYHQPNSLNCVRANSTLNQHDIEAIYKIVGSSVYVLYKVFNLWFQPNY